MISCLRLEQNETVLGLIKSLEWDMWNFSGIFEATQDFSKIKPLFERAHKLTEKELWEDWDDIFSAEILTKGLYFIDSSGQKIQDFILHIHEQEAWGRL